jgi:hypothetical protein
MREAKNAGFVGVGTWRKRYVFRDGKKYVGATRLKREHLAELEAAGEARAVLVFRGWGRQYWLFRGRFHWEDDNLSADDAHALLYEKWRRRERQLERARAVLATESLPRQPRRVLIATEVKEAVFRRDGGLLRGVWFGLRHPVRPRHPGGARWVQ